MVDSQFQANWSGAQAAGLLRGAYHFYQPGADPRQQAAHFLDTVRMGPGDLPPALDVERAGEPGALISGIQAWLAAVEQATGRTPILYTNPTFWTELRTSDFGRFPLWIAEYGAPAPTVPPGWQTWSFWQFSDAGTVLGIEGPVDLDRFHGTLGELRGMARPRTGWAGLLAWLLHRRPPG